MRDSYARHRPPSNLTTLGTMGWITADKVRAGVGCPRCKATVGQSCTIKNRGRGIANHKERMTKYRRQQSLVMQAAKART